jgi:hypothetical protein
MKATYFHSFTWERRCSSLDNYLQCHVFHLYSSAPLVWDTGVYSWANGWVIRVRVNICLIEPSPKSQMIIDVVLQKVEAVWWLSCAVAIGTAPEYLILVGSPLVLLLVSCLSPWKKLASWWAPRLGTTALAARLFLMQHSLAVQVQPVEWTFVYRNGRMIRLISSDGVNETIQVNSGELFSIDKLGECLSCRPNSMGDISRPGRRLGLGL